MNELLEYSELMGDEYGEYLEALHWLAVNPLTDGHLKKLLDEEVEEQLCYCRENFDIVIKVQNVTTTHKVLVEKDISDD